MARSGLIMVAAALAAACTGPPYAAGPGGPGGGVLGEATPRARVGAVTLRTDAQEYARGAGVLLTLVNDGERWASFDPCAATLERLTDGRWETVAASADACVPAASRVPPHGYARHAVRLPADATGRFRYRSEVEDGVAMSYVTVISNTFTVH